MKPLTSFRVYPQASGHLYFKVNIWPTKKMMHAHCWWLNGNFEAACSAWRKIKKGKKTNDLGEINFFVNRLGAGLVSHELLHATMAHARVHQYKRLSFEIKCGMVSDAEEYICDVLGRLTAQFWNKFYRWDDARK